MGKKGNPISFGFRVSSFGFTLIELLVTLSIMAIMSAMLFPFFKSYQIQAKTTSAFSSLKTLQDAMGRYTQMNDDFDPHNWGGTISLAGPWAYFTNASVTNDITFCARVGDSYGNRIISDITTTSSNQSLKLTGNLQQADSVLFYRSGALSNMIFFPVFYNIDETTDNPSGDYTTKNDYINRHGDRVNNSSHPNFPTDSTYIIKLFQ